MGMTIHQALIVTSSDKEAVEIAHKEASERFGDIVSPVVASPTNGYQSFTVFTSGSKLGWEPQEEHEQKLRSFCDYLSTVRINTDWSFPIDFVMVEYSSEMFASDLVAGAAVVVCQSNYARDEDGNLILPNKAR